MHPELTAMMWVNVPLTPDNGLTLLSCEGGDRKIILDKDGDLTIQVGVENVPSTQSKF